MSDNISVSIFMGSKSDLPVVQAASDTLNEFNVPHRMFILSAHRTPMEMMEYAKKAESENIKVIIAGAGGAAHLPGMLASLTFIPIIGVPVESKTLKGIDSLLSIVQMPAGIPVGTLAIGSSGAKNASFLAASILSLNNIKISKALDKWRLNQTKNVDLSPVDD